MKLTGKGNGLRVGGWRSGPAGLEVGGKGKIIANLGKSRELRRKRLKQRSSQIMTTGY